MLDEIPDWAKSCPTRLVKYSSKREAENRTQGSRVNKKFGVRKAFKCDECGSWHSSPYSGGRRYFV